MTPPSEHRSVCLSGNEMVVINNILCLLLLLDPIPNLCQVSFEQQDGGNLRWMRQTH